MKKIKPKFEIGQYVWFVNDYKVLKVKVEEVCVRYEKDNSFVEYTISFKKPDGTEQKKCLRECYFVEDFIIAKNAAILNFNNIVKDVSKQLENMTEAQFDFKEPENDDTPSSKTKPTVLGLGNNAENK